MEQFENYAFVVCKEMVQQNGSNLLQIRTVNIVIFERVVITFHSHAICISQVEFVRRSLG
jgi:Mg2+ and Co2+ transporter CorA